jgi:outer membrane protein assembly factor BamB
MMRFKLLAAVFIPLALGIGAAENLVPPKVGDTQAAPAGDFLQTFTPGANGIPKIFNTCSLECIGDYLYVSQKANWSKACISYFKRASDGALTYGGTEPLVIDQPPELCAAGGRLYVLHHNYCGFSISFFEIEAGSGKPVPKGTNLPIKGDWAGALIADREGKNLYMWIASRMIWLKLGADGQPTLGGDVNGNGFPQYGANTALRLSPDGKNIYSISNATLTIAVVERRPDGSVAFKKSISLDGMDKGKGVKAFGSLSISPDGRWVYAALHRDENPGSSFGVFRRDPESGDLTLQDSGSGNDGSRCDLKFSNQIAVNLVFLPDGTGGYVGSQSGALLQTFRCDPATGRISDVRDITPVDAKQFSTAALLLDAKAGVLYGAGGCGTAQGLWLLKTQVPPAAGPRSDIRTESAPGAQSVSAPLAAQDWQSFRGANCDAKSPLKGIRKDWSGGLQKVWDVSGLSPGTATFSAPVVKGDKLIVQGRHGQVDELFCFDADKGGKPLWILEYATGSGGDYGYGDGPQATPCIDGDKVYFASRQGIFICASLSEGKILWRKGIGTDNHGYGSSPLVWDDLVIISMADGKAIAGCNKETGQKVWVYGDHPGNEGRCGFVSPVRATLAGKEQLVFYFGEHVCGLDHTNGQPLWDVVNGVKFPSFAYCAPIVHENIVYTPYSDSPSTVSVDDGKAAVLWKKQGKDEGAFTPGYSEAVEVDGFLYTCQNQAGFGGFAGQLRCVELKTGQTKWLEKNTGSGTVTYVDGCLIYLNYAGDLSLIEASPAAFKKITEMKGVLKRNTRWMHHGQPGDASLRPGQIPCYTMPAIARGKIYLRLSDELLCYDLMK